jgi:hypothetical protein
LQEGVRFVTSIGVRLLQGNAKVVLCCPDDLLTGITWRSNLRTDIAESGVGGAKHDKSHNQSLFDKILTLFAVLQGLELHIQMLKQIVHWVPP